MFSYTYLLIMTAKEDLGHDQVTKDYNLKCKYYILRYYDFRNILQSQPSIINHYDLFWGVLRRTENTRCAEMNSSALKTLFIIRSMPREIDKT